MKFRHSRDTRAAVRNVTVVREAHGWHIVFACASEHETTDNGDPAPGIDCGIVNNVALSTGALFFMPPSDLGKRHKELAAERGASAERLETGGESKAPCGEDRRQGGSQAAALAAPG